MRHALLAGLRRVLVDALRGRIVVKFARWVTQLVVQEQARFDQLPEALLDLQLGHLVQPQPGEMALVVVLPGAARIHKEESRILHRVRGQRPTVQLNRDRRKHPGAQVLRHLARKVGLGRGTRREAVSVPELRVLLPTRWERHSTEASGFCITPVCESSR